MENELLNEIEEKMERVLENLDKRMATVRAGRANPSSLDGISAEYYGVLTPLKQLAIGCASSSGKSRIHSGGVCDDRIECWKKIAEQDTFLECMAEAACSIVKLFNGNMAFINVMKNISIDCDCNGKAEPPCMKDIGICASVDPIAIDVACLDLVKNCNDEGKEKLLNRVNKMHGTHTIDVAYEIGGIGNKEYELIDID